MLIRPRPEPLVVRSLPWAQVGAVLLLTMAPALLTAARGGRSFERAVLAWTLVVGAVAAYSFDEPARPVVGAAPTTLARRTLTRLVIVMAAMAGSAVVLAALVRLDHAALVGARSHTSVIAAVAALSAAAASIGHRRGADRVSPGAVALGPLSVLVTSALARRYPWLPSVVDDAHTGRWWVGAMAAAAVAMWNARDPARP